MNSKKNNIDKYPDDDLTFIPLNIDYSLAPNGSKFQLPLHTSNISIYESINSISFGFPNLNINPSPIPLNTQQPIDMAPLTPYPQNIPDINKNTSLNKNTNIPNNNFNNNTNNTSLNNNANNNNFNNNNNLNNTNTPGELEYPSELDDDFLYSYNDAKVNERYLENIIDPIDILRNFDLSLEFSDTESRKNKCSEEDINEIFCLIEKEHAGILASMKAYRIPYPIAKLLIKKIIKISLENCKK